MNELEELRDLIEMLKQEIQAMQDKHYKDVQLLNDRIDELCANTTKKT